MQVEGAEDDGHAIDDAPHGSQLHAVVIQETSEQVLAEVGDVQVESQEYVDLFQPGVQHFELAEEMWGEWKEAYSTNQFLIINILSNINAHWSKTIIYVYIGSWGLRQVQVRGSATIISLR